MSNVVKFRRVEKKPEPVKPKPSGGPAPKGPRKLTWEPWAGFFAVALVLYFWQHGLPFGG